MTDGGLVIEGLKDAVRHSRGDDAVAKGRVVYVDGPRCKRSHEWQDEYRRLWNESGWSQDAIAMHLGISLGAAVKWTKKLELKPRRPYAEEYIERLKGEFDDRC